jgi:hypothetical protein
LRVSDEARGRQLPAQTSFCAARLRPIVCSACSASRSYAVAMNCNRRRASAWVIFAAVLRASSASRRQCPASYSGGTHSPGLLHRSNAKASVRFRRELHEWLRRFSRGRGEHRGYLRQLEQHDGITSSPRAGAQDQCATLRAAVMERVRRTHELLAKLQGHPTLPRHDRDRDPDADTYH